MLNSILSDRDTLLDKGFTPGFQVDLHKIGDMKIDSKVQIDVGDGYWRRNVFVTDLRCGPHHG